MHKYFFKDSKLLELSDYDAYDYIKNVHTLNIEDMK